MGFYYLCETKLKAKYWKYITIGTDWFMHILFKTWSLLRFFSISIKLSKPTCEELSEINMQ